MDKTLKERLDEAAHRINSPEFIADDPVQFPRMFPEQEDAEIVALLAAMMAWGRRPMILRDVRRTLDLMDWQPKAYALSGQWEELPDDMNLHRTMFARHLKYLMRGFREIYRKWGSLDAFCAAKVPAGADQAPWLFTEALSAVMQERNEGAFCPECIPSKLDSTALKRINMALRWLVRDDGIVDMGLWRSLKPSQLYIPLDVHVGNVSRSLGLLTRKSNDRKAVLELTSALRAFRPDDPTLYDYALFGLGVTHTPLT